MTDIQRPTWARNAVSESVPPAPFAAAAAMFSCCSMIAGADRRKADDERDDLQVR